MWRNVGRAEAKLVLPTPNTLYGGLVEMVVWSVPEPVPPSSQRCRYRLVFIRDGRRVVGYDNQRGKGDQKHLQSRQSNIKLGDIASLMRDFLADVVANR